jgi:sugar lactone lactonase YvrE
MLSLLLASLFAGEPAPWILGKAYKIPSEYTNQESGYFALISGLDGKLYIGAAKYGVNAYLIEFNPKAETMRLVMDVHKEVGSKATGMAAQAKIHTRNNVGPSGKIYVGTKQGYPEKGEKPDDYPGGYVLIHDPKTGKNEHFGIAKPKHGIISVTPDEKRGLVYVSTCSDTRPIDHTHFMVLDLKTKKYTDLGDMQHAYAFIVLDHQGRAYHPKRGGTFVRYDPETRKLDELKVTIDGKPVGKNFTKDDCIQNWEVSPDRKTLWCVEMTTNALFKFKLDGGGDTVEGTNVGPLLTGAEKGKPRRTDCRAMNVGFDGTVWAAVTESAEAGGLKLVRFGGKDRAPVEVGRIGVANPGFTKFTDDKGKPKPWYHTMPKAKDGTLAPWQPMGIAATPDGEVWVKTIAPYTLIRFTKAQAWR